jgi:hypothetical protein
VYVFLTYNHLVCGEDKLSTPTTDVPDESYKMIFLILITMSQQ